MRKKTSTAENLTDVAANSHVDAAQPSRKRFLQRVRERFFLRGHMTAILAATTVSGVLSNKALFLLGLTPLWTRYPLAILIAYGVFLFLVRVWLAFVTGRSSTDGIDVPDLGFDGVPKAATGTFHGGGGRFSGGGASSSFSTAGQSAGSPRLAVLPRESPPAAPTSGGSSSGWGDLVSLDGDAEGIVVLVAFGILLLVIALAGGYLIFEAPTILGETLFEFSLAAALTRRLKRTDQTDWLGFLLKLTWKPAALVLFVGLVFSGIAYVFTPHAERIGDLVSQASDLLSKYQ